MQIKTSLLIILGLLQSLVIPTFAAIKTDNPISLPAFEIEEATIETVQEGIKNQKLSCESLVKAYIHRIKKYNFSTKTGAPLNAITEINPYAIEEARQLDVLFEKNQQLQGSLHCVPVVIKDSIDSYQMTTTVGSYALLGNQPIKDAFLVKKLKNAGAIILAKTGMDEFAWGMLGVSSRQGRIGNAFDTSKCAGGSSGGTGVAVSANLALVGIGSDNSGSIRIPAAFNGIVGLRPSSGLISQQGIFPMGNLDGEAGPMTRTVTDLALVLDVIAKADPDDEKTFRVFRQKSYGSFLNKSGLAGKRIGRIGKVAEVDVYEGVPANVRSLIEETIQKMKDQGVNFINIDLPQFNNDRRNNLSGEIEEINSYLEQFPSVRKNFKDICESNRTRIFGNPKQCIDFMNRIPGINSAEYRSVIEMATKNRAYVESLMDKNHLDALLIPISRTGVATTDAKMVNTWQAPVASNAGLPSIAIIAGYLSTEDDITGIELPVGVELVGKQFKEGDLISLAYAFEQKIAPRRPPKLLNEESRFTESSIAAMNNFINLLGKAAYDKVLKNGDPLQLTSTIFRDIVKKTIHEFQEKEMTQ